MSSKLLKFQVDETSNPNSLPFHSTGPHQRRWRHTWSFNLHNKFLLSRVEECPKSQREIKKGIKKYYGKKILYITKSQEIKTLISRAKLLKSAEFQKHRIYKNGLKYKGDLVLIGAVINFSDFRFREKKFLDLKKALRHCQEAHITTLPHFKLHLFKYMLALRKLTISLTDRYQVVSLGRIIPNLLNLKEIEVKYADLMPRFGSEIDSWTISTQKNARKNVFFSQFLRLCHLKKMKFICDYKVLQGMNLGEDLDKFYSQPFNFEFHIKINAHGGLKDTKNNSIFWKILNAAEYLKITDPSSPITVTDVNLVLKPKEEVKAGRMNLVEIFVSSFEQKDDEDDEHFEMNYVYDDSEESEGSIKSLVRTEFSSPLLMAFDQIKDKCLSLQHLALCFSTCRMPDMEKMQKKFPKESSAFLKSLNGFVQEISTFEKLKMFELITSPDDFDLLHPDRILSNSNLEVFKLRLSEQVKRISHPKWDEYFTRVTNQIVELSIKASSQAKAPLFEMNLFNFLQTLDNLERAKFVDKSLEGITLDFLHGFLTSLLDRKKMRRISIDTKVMNCVYSRDAGVVFSTGLETHFENMVRGITQDWEKRVGALKELQLEEIFVGRLKGFSFDCLFWNKKMQSDEKLFWIENELREFLEVNKERFQEVFWFSKD